LAGDFHALLRDVAQSEAAESLLQVAADRERFLAIIEKYRGGIVSRTQFLSYVAEQRWPDAIRRRVASMPDAELTALRRAVSDRDYRAAATMIFG
jgi:hypothetical protein